MDSPSHANPQAAAADDAGWTRRFTASEPRLSEMAALYRSLGFDVQLGEATPEPGQDCLVCALDPSFRTIYTRPLSHEAPQKARKRGRRQLPSQ
jgi:hypothetical protein